MNSYASSLRVTDQSTESEMRGGKEKVTTQTAAPTLPHPLYTSVVLTTGVAVGAEATILAMVGTSESTTCCICHMTSGIWGRGTLTNAEPSVCVFRNKL